MTINSFATSFYLTLKNHSNLVSEALSSCKWLQSTRASVVLNEKDFQTPYNDVVA